MSDEAETKARAMGWQPKEDFKGDPEKWVSAKEYVERGENLMPLIKAENRRLSSRVEQLTAKVTESETLLKNAQESIEALKEFNSEANRRAMKESREAIVGLIEEAREEGKVKDEIELGSRLHAVDAAIKEAEKSSGKEEKPKENGKEAAIDPTQTAEFKAWAEANPWFQTDRRRTGLAMGIADEIKKEEPELKGRAFLDRVTEEVEKVFGRPASKVESGGKGTGGGAKKSKAYDDLPPEAKTACARFANRMVGPGKAYKTEAEWQTRYTTDFFAQEQQ